MIARRGFLGAIAAAVAGATLDPERALWVPSTTLISIPSTRVLEAPEPRFYLTLWTDYGELRSPSFKRVEVPSNYFNCPFEYSARSPVALKTVRVDFGFCGPGWGPIRSAARVIVHPDGSETFDRINFNSGSFLPYAGDRLTIAGPAYEKVLG